MEALTWAVEAFGASFAVVTSYEKEVTVVVDPASKISRGVRIVTRIQTACRKKHSR